MKLYVPIGKQRGNFVYYKLDVGLEYYPCVFQYFFSALTFDLQIRPYDSPVLISLACGSLSGIASSTCKCQKLNFLYMQWFLISATRERLKGNELKIACIKLESTCLAINSFCLPKEVLCNHVSTYIYSTFHSISFLTSRKRNDID